MNQSPALATLAQWLAGEFDNQPQAIDQPIWFVHLRLWHRPVRLRIEGNLALFAEQANALQLDRPYRQRIAVLQPTADAQIFRVQYWAFKQPDRFKAAGANPQILESLSLEDLEPLSGCVLTVTQQGDRFTAAPPTDGSTEAKCYFQYEGKTRQVMLGFEVSETQFWSRDRGVDPETGTGLWGALMGAYEYQKRQAFSWDE